MSSGGISVLERGIRRSPNRDTVALLADGLALSAGDRARLEAAAARPERPRRRKSTAPASHNLPNELTSFIGRVTELREIAALVNSRRLVTLVGSGGVGKTRCALRVAAKKTHTFADSAWLVELAPIADGSLVAGTIAQALGIPLSPNRAPLDTVIGYLKRKNALLVLDNCEHVVDEARNVAAAILHACPDVRILSTSREALHVTGEDVYRMPPLELVSAVRLFADRALSVEKRFTLSDESRPHVEEICRGLDGIPLAIELAAARVNVLSPQQLVQRLDERFRVLTGGDRTARARHQTMRALIDWSYNLLSAAEQRAFRTLSVFAGGCTLQSAAAICSEDELVMLDRLSSLAEKSLLQAESDKSGTRYRLLESMRQYARERLVECGEEAVVARAHAATYLALAEALGESYESTSDRAWFSQAEPELENWRSALAWTLSARGDLILGQHLAGALRFIWNFFAPTEGRSWVRNAAQTVDASTDDAVIAKLDLAEAAHDAALYQYKAAYGAAEHALAIYRRLGDVRGEMEAQRRAGQALVFLERIAEGEAQLRAALASAEVLGLRKTIAGTLDTLATARRFAGDVAEARARHAEALAAARATGFDRQAATVALNFAEIEFEGGDAEAALRLVGEALDAFRAQCDAAPLANGLSNMTAYLVALERYAEARSTARDALTLGRDVQGEAQLAFTVQHLAAIAGLRPADDAARARDDHTRAARLLGYADARLAAVGVVREHTELQEYDKLAGALRNALGDDLAKFMAEGSAWTEDQAFAEALLV
jgi:predicted ATPase